MNKQELEWILNNYDKVKIDSILMDYENSYIIRVIKNWYKYNFDHAYKIDFEMSLRDYLIFTRENLCLENYSISDFGKDYLCLFEIDNEICVKPNFPNEISSDFIYSCFDKDIVSMDDETTILKANKTLKKLGYDFYKSKEQKYATIGALNSPSGYTTLIAMTTGGGKSLITQAVSYQKDGFSIIVVPTVSLMLDQYKNSTERIKPASEYEIMYYDSTTEFEPIKKAIEGKIIKILYISPESLIRNEKIRKTIEKANNEGFLKNLIIDEAHIIVEWGASFRVDFQCLNAYKKKLSDCNESLRTFLMSATFSKETVHVLKDTFSDGVRWNEIRCDALRTEQRYCFIEAENKEDKEKKIIDLVSKLPHPMIVYLQSPLDCENTKKMLNKYGINNVKTFTGNTSNVQRQELIHGWAKDEFDIMIATCAFGVGVDKKNVRTVLHLYVPDNPNKFYQEAGRGGRDGKPCLSILLYTDKDIESAFGLTQKALTVEKLQGRWFSMLNSKNTAKLLDQNLIYIDTSTKPNYSENSEILDIPNEQDINWNVYVILLLNRFNKLSILDSNYDINSKKFIFEVKILDNRILKQDDISYCILKDIREKEWSKSEKEFSMMKNMINHSSKICVADTFCKIFNYCEEYCSGCNSHMNIKDYRMLGTIKRDIGTLEFNRKNNLNGYNVKVIGKQLNNTINVVDKICDSIITNNKQIITINSNFYSYFELNEICKNCFQILGNTIAFVIDSNVKNISKTFDDIMYLKNRRSIKLILILEEDYFIPSKNKNISELLEGELYNDYLIKEVFANV